MPVATNAFPITSTADLCQVPPPQTIAPDAPEGEQPAVSEDTDPPRCPCRPRLVRNLRFSPNTLLPGWMCLGFERFWCLFFFELLLKSRQTHLLSSSLKGESLSFLSRVEQGRRVEAPARIVPLKRSRTGASASGPLFCFFFFSFLAAGRQEVSLNSCPIHKRFFCRSGLNMEGVLIPRVT